MHFIFPSDLQSGGDRGSQADDLIRGLPPDSLYRARARVRNPEVFELVSCAVALCKALPRLVWEHPVRHICAH
jgi:hypothetical protein